MVSARVINMVLTDDKKGIKPIAIVLPQFHPIPENNEWWGEGFTEWTNVVKGKPRFKGHYQPHLPKDLGYYDLRLAETREAQAELAKEFGIYGFCYYHYWFNGQRILEQPVDAILESKNPDFPFMLCWANENWSRNWDGGFNKILLEQVYSKQDFINHAKHLVKYFNDERYIRINGRPVFAIYKDKIGEKAEEYIRAFRNELEKNSIDVFLCRFERKIGTTDNIAKAMEIFDAGIEFQPFSRQFSYVKSRGSFYARLKKLFETLKNKVINEPKHSDIVYQYSDVVENDLSYNFQNKLPIFPGVSPGWDNSARRTQSHAIILNNSNPELFKFWVTNKIKKTDWGLVPERFIFVNAWNEWAEGNHLEPCERWGTQYLSAIQEAINGEETT